MLLRAKSLPNFAFAAAQSPEQPHLTCSPDCRLPQVRGSSRRWPTARVHRPVLIPRQCGYGLSHRPQRVGAAATAAAHHQRGPHWRRHGFGGRGPGLGFGLLLPSSSAKGPGRHHGAGRARHAAGHGRGGGCRARGRPGRGGRTAGAPQVQERGALGGRRAADSVGVGASVVRAGRRRGCGGCRAQRQSPRAQLGWPALGIGPCGPHSACGGSSRGRSGRPASFAIWVGLAACGRNAGDCGGGRAARPAACGGC